jgi:ATP-dependent Clp protease protease subunit
MTEDKHERELTQAEIDAEVAKTNAETAVHKARAAKFAAEARRAEAEAGAAEAKAREDTGYSIKQALIHERNIETIMGEDDYRRLYQFRGAVTVGSVEKALIHLNAWHAADPAADWEIHLFTPGGEMYAGMRFLDYLSIFKQTHKVTTVCMGAAYSMGSIILQGGTWRRMGKQSSLLIHKGGMSGWIDGDADKIDDKMEFIHRQQKRIAELFEERAALADKATATDPITAEYIESKWEGHDWYLTSDDCLRYGIVDEVL